MKLWTGRLSGAMDETFALLNNSLPFDQRMTSHDIIGSISWAQGLHRAGLLSQDEANLIVEGLQQILQEYSAGQFQLYDSDEDIHTAVERRLTEIIGPLAGKLHTGRSRNDQVVTDFRIYLRNENRALQNAIKALQDGLLQSTKNHVDTIFPGQTHLRQAQPVSFAHYLLALFFQLQRDRERLKQLYKRCNKMPLGAGALAGAAFDIDRDKLAQELEFDAPTENSYDATSDRDFVNELLFGCSQIMVHLSRIAEDLIIWSSEGYRFVEVDEKYATGSSMMPQKRNPDSLELIRGKTARVLGDQMTLLTLLKGAPTAYVRDLQEDKEPAFDALQQTIQSVQLFEGVARTLQVNAEKMLDALDPALYATDLADYLVRKGMPFRAAHSVVGSIVAFSEREKIPLNEVSLESMLHYSELFDDTVFDLFNPTASLEKRNIQGGSGKKSVLQQIKTAELLLDE